MITGLKPTQLLYRDGTAQDKRLMPALDPGYFNIDERNIEDHLRFAKELAKELKFFDEENKPVGNWENFLNNGVSAAEIISYINSPQTFLGDAETLRKLSAPHLVLFVTFLQLLGHIKNQLNTFTQKHLDYYYREILGLTIKKAIPDVVNVIVELAGNVNELLIDEGTALLAGKDSAGKELIYKTESPVTVSQARISEIKTLFVDKKITDIEAAKKEHLDDKDQGLTKMMELALGDPKPADPLPLFKGEAVDYKVFKKIYNQFVELNRNVESEEYKYLTASLFLSFRPHDECKTIIATAENTNATEADWKVVYDYLDKAYKAKEKWGRQHVLKQKHTAADGSFLKMFEYALGVPALAYKLPPYKNNPVTIDTLVAISTSIDKKEADINLALEYVTEELLLTESDFTFCIKTYRNKSASFEDWQKVYAVVEVAQRKKRNIQQGSPVVEKWLNVFAMADAKAGAFSVDEGEQASTVRFNTFGKSNSAKEMVGAQPAAIGFAIASSQLLLQEGKRKIKLTIGFKETTLIPVAEIVKELPGSAGQQPHPFVVYASNNKGWVNLPPVKIEYGNFLVEEEGEELSNPTLGQNVISTTAPIFKKQDEGKYVMWSDGRIFCITNVKSDRSVEVTANGVVLNYARGIRKYNSSSVYLNAMQVQLSLTESDPPLEPPADMGEVVNIKSSHPVLALVLNNIAFVDSEKSGYINLYQQFKDLLLHKVNVSVTVSDLQIIALENDQQVLDYKKPFEPFGYRPESGNSLYFTHPEISSKRLDTLSINFHWLKAPGDFRAYYQDYRKVELAKPNLTNADYKITGNDSFKAMLTLVDNKARIPLETISLFKIEDATAVQTEVVNVPKAVIKSRPAYNYNRNKTTIEADEVTNQSRYFTLELGTPDFQHNAYPLLLARQASIAADPSKPTADEVAIRRLPLNTPYTPKLKNFTLGYSASFEVNTSNISTLRYDEVFHITAFGHKQLNLSEDNLKPTYFLPYFNNEGEMYLGISHITLPQNLSILFQMAEGSSNPDADNTTVNWSYLSNSVWVPFKADSIVSDTTNGLQNTGIIQFNIPIAASGNHTLLTPNLVWLRAAIRSNTDAIPDMVDIIAQALSARFIDNDNAADHLATLLPRASVKETVVKTTGIKKIHQPFTSSKGSPPEVETKFYNRVSERLRHKSRALTMWDYERIILEKFPDIYKVKCIPAATSSNSNSAGKVDVIVIPDIRGKLPFNPFEPKVPSNIIAQIQAHLQQRMSAFASVQVKNPKYLHIKARFAVKFNPGFNPGFFTQTLNQELKHYLAPWAYNEGADIVIGGKVYPNVIVNFIAERPYVDYVAAIKLFESDDGKVFKDVKVLHGENVIKARSPDVILVSALSHIIDLIAEEGYEENSFSGINYMRVGLDFTIG